MRKNMVIATSICLAVMAGMFPVKADTSLMLPDCFAEAYEESLKIVADNLYQGQDALPEEAKLYYTETVDDVIYYDNLDWTIELAWIYEEEASADSEAEALYLNIASETELQTQKILFMALSQVLADWDDTEADKLALWFEQADKAGEYHNTERYEVRLSIGEDYRKYRIIPIEDGNNVLPEGFIEGWYLEHWEFVPKNSNKFRILQITPAESGFEMSYEGMFITSFRDDAYVLSKDGKAIVYQSDDNPEIQFKLVPGKRWEAELYGTGYDGPYIELKIIS